MKITRCFSTVLFTLFLIATCPKGSAQVAESLRDIEDEYVAAFKLHVEEGHQAKVAELNTRYVAALGKALQTASKANRLDEALALKEEMKRVPEKDPLPPDENAHPALVKLRNNYRDQLAKFIADRQKAAAPILKKFDEALASLQSTLTKAGKLEEAHRVQAYRASGEASRLLGMGDSEGRSIIHRMNCRTAKRTPEGITFREGSLDSKSPYKPPLRITYLLRTDSTDIRIGYAATQIIFNWSLGKQELRIDGGPANSQHKPNCGEVPVNRFVRIEQEVRPDQMTISVDGQQRASWKADFSRVDEPIRVSSAGLATLTVKDVLVDGK